MNLQHIKDWMVWAETYLIWGMILGSLCLSLYFIWEGVDRYQAFNQILQNEPVEEVESEIELLHLRFSKIRHAQKDAIYRYVTLKKLMENAPLDNRVSKLERANSTAPINNLVGFQSFLLKEQHYNFWTTQFIFLLIFYHGGWSLACLFFCVFGYLNLKQDDKLLTKEIRRLIESAFFLFMMGYFGYDFLNSRTINFLNEQFSLSQSAGVMSSTELNWVLMALLLAYALISKAVPVQEEQDLTV